MTSSSPLFHPFGAFYRRKLVTTDGGFLNPTSVLSLISPIRKHVWWFREDFSFVVSSIFQKNTTTNCFRTATTISTKTSDSKQH